jgi:acetyl-CoA synthetase
LENINKYTAKSEKEYKELYKQSIDNPESFWKKIADTFLWKKKWNNILSFDFNKPEFKWFEGGSLNITENCLDRHLVERADQTAILFEPNDPEETSQSISYRELYNRVCKFSNVLKNNNIKKGGQSMFIYAYGS